MIAIIIPTFNEKENIFKLCKKLLKLNSKLNIFVIDDTKKYNLYNEFKKYKKIKYINRINQKGRGSAVLQGLKLALKNNKIKIFVEMDADFSHRPQELNRNLNFFLKNRLDLLISSRYLKNSKIYNWSILRRIFSYLANILAEILLNVGASDYTNGYRIYSKKSAKLITKKCGNIGDGFIVLSEILLHIKLNRLKIDETKSIFINRKRGESSVNLKLIFHCFTGSKKLLEFCIENNYYISLSGIVTFKNASSLREIIVNASLDHLLIETDSPFLAPVPMRGKSNEPSFVKFTGEFLAEFYSMSKENFFDLTNNNFYKLFSRAKRAN